MDQFLPHKIYSGFSEIPQQHGGNIWNTEGVSFTTCGVFFFTILEINHMPARIREQSNYSLDGLQNSALGRSPFNYLPVQSRVESRFFGIVATGEWRMASVDLSHCLMNWHRMCATELTWYGLICTFLREWNCDLPVLATIDAEARNLEYRSLEVFMGINQGKFPNTQNGKWFPFYCRTNLFLFTEVRGGWVVEAEGGECG